MQQPSSTLTSAVADHGETNPIRVIGANVHNLRDVSVDIPTGRLTVVTGVSGSGKSSLVFDTLFAEGRRRYLQCVSRGDRGAVQSLDRPDVEDITDLPPTLCIEQRVPRRRRRATLATVTEIGDYLQVLYARAGTLVCPRCGAIVQSQTRQAVAERILAYPAGAKVMLLAPVVRGKTGRHESLFPKIAARGFVRARVDGEVIDLHDPPLLAAERSHDVEVVVDRLIIREGIDERLKDSLAQAFDLADGMTIVTRQAKGESDWIDELFSIVLACPGCGTSYPSLQPNTFSFNSPYGACKDCDGLGVVIPPPTKNKNARPAPDEAVPCRTCEGTRLGELGRKTSFFEYTLPTLTAWSVAEAVDVVGAWETRLAVTDDPGDVESELTPSALTVARRLVPEIVQRLGYLNRIGLGYLELNRAAATLSAGEFQRARLAATLGMGPAEACYVLDEPTSGLHPRDTDRLLGMLRELRDQGCTVVTVEHDLDVMRQADHVIDLGPGAGKHGGHLVASGTPEELEADNDSITGRFLHGEDSFETVPSRGPADQHLRIESDGYRNLRDIDLPIPLGRLVGVTGVSGSGKSTLVMDLLVPALKRSLAGDELTALPVRLTDEGGLERVREIDQRLPGTSRRGNAATFSGMWTATRRLFAKTRVARMAGFTARHFSFNAKEGRCPDCGGLGVKTLRMKLSPNLELPCDACGGTRFRREIRQVTFRGASVDDVLSMTFSEAAEFFDPFAKIRDPLRLFCDVGLDYLTVGQPLTTLSGGEIQRLKLGTELTTDALVKTLFVLDEPTTGLHPADIGKLLTVFHRLVDAGHSVLVIEHQFDVISRCDWVIDLGPEPGPGGGRVIYTGPPDRLVNEDSATGRAMAKYLSASR